MASGFAWYHQKGDERELKTGTSSNYMSRLGNRAFSFVEDAEEEIREKKMMEALDFWRNITEGKMLIQEDIHPLTRQVMGEA